jgi:Cytochrome oxidase complex assembly protein 1
MEQTEQRTWWGRNWKWILPLGCLVGVVFCAGFAAIILGSMRSSWACSEGVTLARHNEKVVEKLGEPIETGWLVSGSIKVAGPSGSADLAVPLHGPHNSGTLYVVAHEAAGQWRFDRAEVEVNGLEKRIDLLTKRQQENR